MPTDLKALIEGARKQAHRVLIEKRQDQLIPFYHLIVPGEGRDVVIATPCRNEDERVASIAAVAATANMVGAVAALFLSEGWMSVHDMPLTPWHANRLLANHPPPSEDPKRKEVVFALASDGEQTECARWQIVRDKPGGRIIALVEDDISNNTIESRLMDGIIPKRRKP
jgi:hypothetical protein